MFNSKKKSVSRKTLTTTADSYGDKTKTYTSQSNILMFISLSTEDKTQSNNMSIQQATHIGLTSGTVSVGDVIDNKYTIEYINAAGVEKICYMKEFSSNGSFLG